MSEFEKANAIFNKYCPDRIKLDKKNSPGGIPQVSEIMSARASALQQILQNNSFSDIEKDEILWAINIYNKEARNTKNRE
nr:hypothetical protein [uncultured Treponema sp.]